MTNALLGALACLSLNAYHEARGEPFLGQMAVSQVLLRRANFDPARVCAELRRPKQFSWVGRVPRPRSQASWREAQRAARTTWLHAVVGGRTDPSAGADHYYATWIKAPHWAPEMTVVTRIGDHVFLKSKP